MKASRYHGDVILPQQAMSFLLFPLKRSSLPSLKLTSIPNNHENPWDERYISLHEW